MTQNRGMGVGVGGHPVSCQSKGIKAKTIFKSYTLKVCVVCINLTEPYVPLEELGLSDRVSCLEMSNCHNVFVKSSEEKTSLIKAVVIVTLLGYHCQ